MVRLSAIHAISTLVDHNFVPVELSVVLFKSTLCVFLAETIFSFPYVENVTSNTLLLTKFTAICQVY